MSKIRIRNEEMNLLTEIAKHRYVDLDFIHIFIYPNLKKDTIKKKIINLKKNEFIIDTYTFIPKGYTAQRQFGYRIFALGKVGLQYMKEEGTDVDDNTKMILTTSPYRMYHQVQVATVDDTLYKYYSIENAGNPFLFIRVLNEKESYNEELKHQPDAIAIMQSKSTGAYASLFIEVERSYATNNRLRSKLLNYKSEIQNRYYVEKIDNNIIRYRLLFISQSENEYEILKNKLELLLDEIDVDVACVMYHEFIKNPVIKYMKFLKKTMIKKLGFLKYKSCTLL